MAARLWHRGKAPWVMDYRSHRRATTSKARDERVCSLMSQTILQDPLRWQIRTRVLGAPLVASGPFSLDSHVRDCLLYTPLQVPPSPPLLSEWERLPSPCLIPSSCASEPIPFGPSGDLFHQHKFSLLFPRPHLLCWLFSLSGGIFHRHCSWKGAFCHPPSCAGPSVLTFLPLLLPHHRSFLPP